MYYQRALERELKNSAASYPVVTLMGPRQSGKTTLVKHVFPDKPYINLEALDVRELALTDPRYFLAQYPDGAILDEIQRAPQLLSYLQVMVDERQQKGLFILTGSHQISLHEAISQSLAGRTALLQLLPMSLQEVALAEIRFSLDESLLMGGYPRVLHDQLEPTKAHRNYLQTYIERDLRQLLNVKDLLQFQKFLKLCVSRIGQILNLDGLANETGISSHTVKHWISILEASYVVFRLQPYFENWGKRIVKSPKLYFTDVGLACYLLGIENTQQLSRDPLRGSLFENLVVLELLKSRLNQGLESNLYYFRDAHGHEIDLLLQNGRDLIPIEIKSAQTFQNDFLKNIRYFLTLSSNRVSKSFLVYTGDLEQHISGVQLLNYLHLEKIFNGQN